MAKVVDPKTRRWLTLEAQKVADADTGGVLHLAPVHKDLIAEWRRDAPQTVARLEASSLLTEAALVMWNRFDRAEREYRSAGMSPTDAREQAANDWLTLTGESLSPPQDAPITS